MYYKSFICINIIIVMLKKEFIDNMIVSQEIWKYLKTIREQKDIKYEEIWEKIWKSPSYVINILNWRWRGNYNNFEMISWVLWIPKKEFEKLVRQIINKINNSWVDKNSNIDYENITPKEVVKLLKSMPIKYVLKNVLCSRTDTSTDEKTLDDIIRLAEMRIKQWDTWFLSALLKDKK